MAMVKLISNSWQLWQGDEIVSPCGACRQVLMELLPQDCPVILANRESYEITTMKELLPRAFIGESLTCSNQDL